MTVPRRVLVVEDNRDAAEMLRVLLEIEGHHVVEAHDGPTAIALALQHRPDVALIDIGLPAMDGCEVARRLRNEARLAHTLLVALTGHGREQDIETCRQAGFDRHLVKPADIHAVLKVLDEAPPPAASCGTA